MAENRRSAYLGAGLLICFLLLVICTIWLLAPSPRAIESLVGAFAVATLIGLMVTMLPWERLPRLALLVYPALAVGALGCGALGATSVSSSYNGLFVLVFIYVGLTQSRGVPLACLPIAVPAYILCGGKLTPQVEVKLPIAIGIWLLVGELLASRSAHTRRRDVQLTTAASTDSLTGLRNRRDLPSMLSALQPGDGVVLVDLDHFKQINDVHGHAAGDRVLAEFGAVLRAVIRGGDMAVRYGGEEILLLLPRSGVDGAEVMLARLRGCWRSPVRPTFSAGVAVHDHGPADATIQRADLALYRAKQAGRDCWHREVLSA